MEDYKNLVKIEGEKHPIRIFAITLGLSLGSKDVMFVLYSITRPTETVKTKPVFTYMGQLSNDFDKAVEVAKERVNGYEIELWDKENFEQAKPLLIKFGKYKGKTIEEVYDIDSGYIFWMSNNINLDMNGKRFNEKLAEYAKLSRDLIIQKNEEKSLPHLPIEDTTSVKKLTIYSISTDSWDNIVNRMLDENGNRIQYSGSRQLGEKGETVELKCRVKKHFSSMGLNFNVVGLRNDLRKS